MPTTGARRMRANANPPPRPPTSTSWCVGVPENSHRGGHPSQPYGDREPVLYPFPVVGRDAFDALQFIICLEASKHSCRLAPKLRLSLPLPLLSCRSSLPLIDLQAESPTGQQHDTTKALQAREAGLADGRRKAGRSHCRHFEHAVEVTGA
eukprot:scaffold310_cov302-Prasinococcus_capsulatus_cf.AAC.3